MPPVRRLVVREDGIPGVGGVLQLADTPAVGDVARDQHRVHPFVAEISQRLLERLVVMVLVIPHMDIAHHTEPEVHLGQRRVRHREDAPTRQCAERGASAEEETS